MNMRFLIDCIDDDAIMDVGPAHRLIPLRGNAPPCQCGVLSTLEIYNCSGLR
jgi:hypothetical protein